MFLHVSLIKALSSGKVIISGVHKPPATTDNTSMNTPNIEILGWAVPVFERLLFIVSYIDFYLEI